MSAEHEPKPKIKFRRNPQISTEVHTRYIKYEVYDSSFPPPSFDQHPPAGFTSGESASKKPTTDLDAVRQRAKLQAEKAFGTEEDDTPWWAD